MLHKLREVCPWVQDSDGIIARRFCELEVILGQVYGAIREKGAFKADGEVRGLVDAHRRLTQTQAMLASQLGLTPAARIAMQASSRGLDVDIEAALGRMEKVKSVATTDPEGYCPKWAHLRCRTTKHMKPRHAAALISTFLLYVFCGAGIYWNFLSWFHSENFADLSGGIIPLLLLWVVWTDSQGTSSPAPPDDQNPS
jgi:hypothetical protein